MPQPLQCAGSVAVLTQTPEQLVVPVPHEVVHVPIEQTWPAVHARPHMPQLALSVVVLVSQPLAAFMSQSAKPVAHAPRTHVPVEQVAAALAKRQTTPHPPQLFASVPRRLRSQPFEAVPSQSPKPVAQPPTTHPPATQALTLTLARAHARAQAPQFDGSVLVFTHAPEQLVVPAPHETPQVPDAQV
jgi:hypothetical protein